MRNDHACHRECGLDDERRSQQGKHMSLEDARGDSAQGHGRLDMSPLLQRQGLSTGQPGETDPADRRQRDHNILDSRPKNSGQGDSEQNTGKCEKHIDEPHQHLVPKPPSQPLSVPTMTPTPRDTETTESATSSDVRAPAANLSPMDRPRSS